MIRISFSLKGKLSVIFSNVNLVQLSTELPLNVSKTVLFTLANFKSKFDKTDTKIPRRESGN